MNEKERIHWFVRVLWGLYFSFVIYLVLTLVLVLLNPNGVRVMLIFDDLTGNLFGAAIVLFYLVAGPCLTWYLYKRAFRTPPSEAVIYVLGAVIVGVATPYIYALLVSFMGIMRDILPVLFIAFFYVAGILVGLRIIPELTRHLRSE